MLIYKVQFSVGPHFLRLEPICQHNNLFKPIFRFDTNHDTVMLPPTWFDTNHDTVMLPPTWFDTNHDTVMLPPTWFALLLVNW